MRQSRRRTRRTKRVIACFLSLILTMSGALLVASTHVAEATDPAYAASDAANSGTAAVVSAKEEIVYARLAEDGEVKSGYVVNHFEVASAGRLTDRGAYAEVKNLSTTDPLSYSGIEVGVPVDAGDFYYQGTLESAQLPWTVNITYFQEGREVARQALAGAFGEIEIRIAVRENTRVVSPTNASFRENYVLQIQLTLESSRARNIVAPDASIATSGENHQVIFTVLPDREAEYALTAEVSNFEMPGITIGALPFSMAFDFPDTSSMEGDLLQLAEAIALLDDGVRELSGGVSSLRDGAAALATGSSQFHSGFAQLSGTSDLLNNSSGKIRAALGIIAAQLANGEVNPAQLQQLIDALGQLADMLSSEEPATPGISEALVGVKTGLDAVLGTSIPAAPATAKDDLTALGALLADSQFQALAGLDSEAANAADAMQNIVGSYPDYLSESQVWMNTAQTAYFTGGGTAASPPLQATLEQLATGTAAIAAQLNLVTAGLEQALANLSGLPALAAGIATLAGDYAQFDDGLTAYTSGVKTLSDSYSGINAALGQFASGIDQLSSGTVPLLEGTAALRTNTADMPQRMQEQIDNFAASYDTSGFEPVSFVSEQNKNVKLVQFVLSTDAITLPAPDDATTDIPEPDEDFLSHFLSRLLALFGLAK
jgi:X-X-X-Leu-X-X-Gly heptad repeat protein